MKNRIDFKFIVITFLLFCLLFFVMTQIQRKMNEPSDDTNGSVLYNVTLTDARSLQL
jgi:hypothetical protein